MKYFLLCFFLLTFNIFSEAKKFIESLEKHEKTLRVSSKEFKDLLSQIQQLSIEELDQVLSEEFKGKKLKNLLALISRIKDKKSAFKILMDKALSAEDNKSLYSYFAYIVYEPEYLNDYKDKLKIQKDIKPFLAILDSQSSPLAFDIIFNFHSDKNDFSEALLNTVHDKNLDKVLSIFKRDKKLGHKLGSKLLMVDSDKFSAETVLLMLKTRKSEKKETFTPEQMAELAALYNKLNEENFETVAAQILSPSFSIGLNHKTRSRIDLQSPIISKLFLAKSLNFDLEAYEKYEEFVQPLHSADIKDRLKSLLRLGDYHDPVLAPSFLHLLDDPSSDVRRDSLDCLTALMENQKSSMAKFLPFEDTNDPMMVMSGKSAGNSSASEVQEKNLNKIILLLNDPAPAVTVAAIELLTHLDDDTANTQIAQLLSSTNRHILLASIESIERNEIADGLLKLIDLLKHKDWQVRARSAKAINEFDNKGQYLSNLEKLFFKEKDAFVRDNIFNFLTATTNQKIFDYLKENAQKAVNPVIKYENLVQLLRLKNLPISEIEKLRPLFHKFEDSSFVDKWLNVAGNKKLNIDEEVKLIFAKGSSENKKEAIWVAGRRGIDITPFMKEETYRDIGYSNLFYYLRTNKLLEIKPKLAILNAIFGDIDFPEYTKALERLNSSLRSSLNLNKDERKKVATLLRSIKAKVSGPAQIMISVILKEKIPDKSVDSLMKDYQDEEKRDLVAPAIKLMVKTFSSDQIKQYQKQLTGMLLENQIRPYEITDKLKDFSIESLKELYENGGSYKHRYLRAMAGKLPMKEVLELSKALVGSRNVSQYEIYGIIGEAIPKMTKGDIKSFLGKLEQSNRDSLWELSEMLGKVPDKVKGDALAMYKENKLKASASLFYIIFSKFDPKEFDTFYKFLSETKLKVDIFSYGTGRPSFSHFYNSIKQKIENTKIDYKSLQFFENILSLSKIGGVLNNKISITSLEKQAADIDKKYYARVFEILENSGSKSEAYYDIYLKLLEGNVDPVIFKQEKVSPNRHMYSHYSSGMSGSSGTSLLKKLFKKKDKAAELKDKVIARLVVLKDNNSGARLNILARRLSQLVDINQYVKLMYKNFKINPGLTHYLPSGKLNSDSFKLLKSNVDLKLIPQHIALNIGRNLDINLAKELIAEYRKDPDSGLWHFIIEKLGPDETDIILSQTFNMFPLLKESIFNNSQRHVRTSMGSLLRKLNHISVKKNIHNYLTVNIDNIENVYALALLNVRVPEKSLSNFFKLKDLTDDHKEMIINTFYINRIYSKEVFAFHEEYLKTLKGKALAEAIKLSPAYHHGNQENNNHSYSQENMSIRQVISYSGLSYSRGYGMGEKTQALKIPEESQAAFKSLKAKKLELYKLANDPSLLQFVSDKSSLTLSMTINQLKGDADDLSGPLLESLNSQFKKATHEELKTFLDLIGQKDIYLDIDYDTDYFEGLDEKKLTYLNSYREKTTFQNVKSFLSSITLKLLKTDADFDKLVVEMMKSSSGGFYDIVHELEPVKDKFKRAVFRYAEKNDISDQRTASKFSYMLSELELSHKEASQIDEKLPTYPEKVQMSFAMTVLHNGPYYPNALKLQLKMMEKPNMNNVNLDLVYLYYEEKLDLKKLEKVKETFDKIQTKKLEIYKKPPMPQLKSLTLIFHQDIDYIKKELNDAVQNNTLLPFDFYILERFTKEEHEKYAKQFWEKFKDSDSSYYIIEYLMKYEYNWLPKAPAPDIEFFE